jgi:hypothetical protein
MTSDVREGQLETKVGAGAVIVGALLVFLGRALHGDLPTDTGANSLDYVAGYSPYHVVHLVANLGVLTGCVGWYVLAASFTDRVAAVLARLGAAAAVIGAAVYIVDFAIDGYGLASLANAWVDASEEEKAGLDLATNVVTTALGGVSVHSLFILWGAVPIVFALAALRDGYPRILGWIGLAVGTVMLVSGVAFFLTSVYVVGEDWLGAVVYIFAPLFSLAWSIGLGLAMWRRSGTAVSSPPRP